MPTITPVFLLGLAIGTTLIVLGVALGFWFGRNGAPPGHAEEKKELLQFMREIASWTNEFSGDVSAFHAQLSDISGQVNGSKGSADEITKLLAKMMAANHQLQERLNSTESKLEAQTDELSSYVNEARTDALTGLLNRRAFDVAQDELFAHWETKRRDYTLGLFDIDHFKQINDNYGHPTGDAVLKQVAGLLTEHLGKHATCVARYGGEEFAILSTLPLSELADILDRTRALLSQHEIVYEGRTIAVTISAGAAEIAMDDNVGHIVRRADEALYAAKLGGRNRVYIHDGTLCRLITEVDPQSTPQLTHSLADQRAKPRIQERLSRIVEEESRRVLGSEAEQENPSENA